MAKFSPNYDAFEDPPLTISSTAVALTAATYTKERSYTLITVEDGAVRFRLDGTDPATDVGHTLEPGDVLKLDSFMQLKNARFVRRDGTDAVLSCSYGR